MFDHVKFGVSDYAASKAFFLKALEVLGIAAGSNGTPAYGGELCGTGTLQLHAMFESDRVQNLGAEPI